jgi:hypothetical protein
VLLVFIALFFLGQREWGAVKQKCGQTLPKKSRNSKSPAYQSVFLDVRNTLFSGITIAAL